MRVRPGRYERSCHTSRANSVFSQKESLGSGSRHSTGVRLWRSRGQGSLAVGGKKGYTGLSANKLR